VSQPVPGDATQPGPSLRTPEQLMELPRPQTRAVLGYEHELVLVLDGAYPRPRTLGMIPKAPVLDIFIGRDDEGACLGWTRCACSATWCNAPVSFG
jgi:hypothetical protein